jgi:asparagine synthase (glutamine-hydrolysing)
MCGIAGFLQLDHPIEQNNAHARLNRMIDVIRHRGPDDRGVWSDDHCALAQARLSIIDLSPAGHQPMPSGDRTCWITFNGEIYNFQEIRTQLELRGVVFKSHSDTEVILEGYRVWGDAVLERLRGMFAFALWDQTRQRLLLARDRLGKKPLYWAKVGDALVFGSELKALVAWPGLDRSIDYASIDQYLTFSYIMAPRTIFKRVAKLPAAHKMVIERDRAGGWNIGEPQAYWRLSKPSTAPAFLYDPVAQQEELVRLLKESTRLRMIADVPLGAFLSGGVDSSAVVAMMALQSDKPVKTFSIGFPNQDYDETRYARQVAERYGTDHEELILEPKAADILPRLIWHYNEPFADPSMIPTYYVSELARQHVTVALNGDGGDEAFIGYGRYDTARTISSLGGAPRMLAPLIAAGLKITPRALTHGKWGDKARRIAQALAEQGGSESQRIAFTIAYFMDHQKRSAYGPAMQDFVESSALDHIQPYFDEAPSLVSGLNWSDTHTYLPENLMPKVDVASMAVSLEGRSPLLDHKLMEWAFTLPEAVKTPGGISKGLFKKAMEPYLPHELLYRPKMGFGCPIDHWLRGDLKEMAHDVLLSDRAADRGIVTRESVSEMLNLHVSGREAHHTRLFALLNLELWFRMWADQTPDAALERPPVGMNAAAMAAE